MKLIKGEIYYPQKRNNNPVKWLAICAHQDDAEIMAIDGILKGYYSNKNSFALIETTDGAGITQKEKYPNLSIEQIKNLRNKEQKEASEIGKYNSIYLLGYTSDEVKDINNKNIISEYIKIITELKPEIVYTHSILDKHPTHVSVALKVIEAIRNMPTYLQPKKIYGCEVWRSLDWVSDEKKIIFDISKNIKLQKSLLDVYKSQIIDGKEYSKSTIARRIQNSTYAKSHQDDEYKLSTFAIDMTPLINDKSLNIDEYALSFIDDLKNEVLNNFKK